MGLGGDAMIRAAIFDWAGTVVDHGSRAPMGAFVEAFARFGVAITVGQARGPMGMAKADHIRLVGAAVNAAWRARHGRDFSEADVQAIFGVFEPLNVASVESHAALIPGAKDALGWCAARGIRIGSTTGYTRPIMHGWRRWRRAVLRAGGDGLRRRLAAGGRAAADVARHAAMGVFPARSVVKLDDTAAGIGEGRGRRVRGHRRGLTGNIPG